MIAYHDDEWGVAVHDDRRLFEALILEGAQAGLSWETVLRKREAYRKAYRGFDPTAVARFGARDRARLLADDGLIRHPGKIDWSIRNAKAFLALAREHGSFDTYLRERAARQPDRAALSRELSADLRRRGFGFVGPTIVYAFLQAVGIADDHEPGCFRATAR